MLIKIGKEGDDLEWYVLDVVNFRSVKKQKKDKNVKIL
jgi:hypothetical protein